MSWSFPKLGAPSTYVAGIWREYFFMGSVWNGKKLSIVTWATAKLEDIAYTAK